VKSIIFLLRIVKMKLVTVEMTAAAIWSPFYIYNFLKICTQSCWIDGSEKSNRLLLQKHVICVWLVVLLAYANVGIVTPSQLVELTLMKILHIDTKVEQTAINTKIMMIAKITRNILLQTSRSRLSQLIYSGSLTLSLITRN
jgi:tRNA isopentenyl-2-thiomethyl-A-37 hydroxylase MiaE